MNENIKKEFREMEKGFFGFWVKRYRVSYLVIFLVIIAGLFSLFTIPKESSPDIKFGIISITTVYPGVNPSDIDSLITEKIEKEIKNIEGIKKIESSSQVGVSSTIVELYNGVNTRNALTDIKDAIDKIDFPEDANDTSVVEISTQSDLLFEVLLYGDEKKFSQFELMQKAQFIKNTLESKIRGISSIDIGSADLGGGMNTTSSDYEILVLIDKQKLEVLQITIPEITNAIRNYNKNTPIGNFTLGDLRYDFRFDGELTNEEKLKDIVVRSSEGSKVFLKDIATIKKEYPNEAIAKLGLYGASGYNYVSLLFMKEKGIGVFSVADSSKKSLEELLGSSQNLRGLSSFYVKDMSSNIIDDYKNLGSTAIQTAIIVFIVILIFVGLKESIIASLLLPLAFFVTFFVLDTIGFSLNFLTNFSLVLTLGIAIDTVIVVIEGASEKQSLGYNKKTAILLSLRDYGSPLIAGTMTTLAAFLPIIFLPGIYGKFLSYIPITVFSTLLAALLLSLTVSSALYVLFVKEKKSYHQDEKYEATMSLMKKEFLAFEREGKKEKKEEKYTLREAFLEKISGSYESIISFIVGKKIFRILAVSLPIIFLFLSFGLSKSIGFNLFPSTDEGIIQGSIETKNGSDKKVLEKYIPQIDDVIAKIPELKVYNLNLQGNRISMYIELIDKKVRSEKNMNTSFEVEDVLRKEFHFLESEGLSVSLKGVSNGPPGVKPVGVKLIAQTNGAFEELQKISYEIKEKFEKVEGLQNISTTVSDSPGQFIFEFDNEKLFQLGLQPDDILTEVYLYTNGMKAGSIKSRYEDNDIVIKVADFEEELSPKDIENLLIQTRIGKIKVGDLANYSFKKSVDAIKRVNTKVSITVESDIEKGYKTSDLQPQLTKIVADYNLPAGITYEAAGENQDNSELITSTIRSFFIALFLIFSILVFQFNSFRQPSIVLFSVLLATLGVNIGLFITNNPYSMTMGIGFIALTGVVVNDAIILIDRMNKNMLKGIDKMHSIISAAKSRLQPIMVTTLTTVFGVLPLALQDKFWAGLGYTMIFGLVAGSLMTLFVIPSLYYMLVKDKK